MNDPLFFVNPINQSVIQVRLDQVSSIRPQEVIRDSNGIPWEAKSADGDPVDSNTEIIRFARVNGQSLPVSWLSPLDQARLLAHFRMAE